MVSDFDLLARDGETAGEVMTPDVVTVSEDTDIQDGRALIIEQRLARLPVFAGASSSASSAAATSCVSSCCTGSATPAARSAGARPRPSVAGSADRPSISVTSGNTRACRLAGELAASPTQIDGDRTCGSVRAV